MYLLEFLNHRNLGVVTGAHHTSTPQLGTGIPFQLSKFYADSGAFAFPGFPWLALACLGLAGLRACVGMPAHVRRRGFRAAAAAVVAAAALYRHRSLELLANWLERPRLANARFVTFLMQAAAYSAHQLC